MVKKKKPTQPEQPSMVDRRANEKVHTYVDQITRGQNFSSLDELNAFLGKQIAGKRVDEMELAPTTALEAAQQKMYEAFEARSKTRRVELAKEALKICADCADAYVLLAEEAKEAKTALPLYQKGIEAGRRALGEDQ